MAIHKEYFLKIKQPDYRDALFDNIEGTESVESVQTSDNLSINNNYLQSSSNLNNRVFINNDICASINSEISTPSESVPLSDKYRYLYKIGGEYKFLKERPYKNILFNDATLLELNNLTYADLVAEGYADYVQTAVETLPQDNGEVIYKCYSFNFGGISKASATFYGVNYDQLILIDTSDPLILVDYIEGNIYIPEGVGIYSTVIGLFNVDPIIVEPKGNLPIKETVSDFYKIINNSNKGNLSITYTEYYTLLSCTKNMYVYGNSLGARVMIDGIPLKEDYKLFIPKNTTVIIEYKVFVGDIETEDSYVFNADNIEYQSSSKSSTTTGDFSYNGSVTSTPTDNRLLYIVQEVEKNTYNFSNPSILELKQTWVEGV